MNNDGVVDNFDIQPFEQALANPSRYLAAFPSMTNAERIYRGDVNSDSAFNNFDIGPFEFLLANGHYPSAPVLGSPGLRVFAVGGRSLALPRRATRRQRTWPGASRLRRLAVRSPRLPPPCSRVTEILHLAWRSHSSPVPRPTTASMSLS